MAFAHDFDLPAGTAEGIPADEVNEKQRAKMQPKVTGTDRQSCIPSTNAEENSNVKLSSSGKLTDLTTDRIEKHIVEPTNVPIGEFLERKETVSRWCPLIDEINFTVRLSFRIEAIEGGRSLLKAYHSFRVDERSRIATKIG